METRKVGSRQEPFYLYRQLIETYFKMTADEIEDLFGPMSFDNYRFYLNLSEWGQQVLNQYLWAKVKDDTFVTPICPYWFGPMLTHLLNLPKVDMLPYLSDEVKIKMGSDINLYSNPVLYKLMEQEHQIHFCELLFVRTNQGQLV